ncbi:efflux RND transporter periplasmic adaptor subunit [bacterium]|nr:efflux RND transporter periplasmic adaptor subunit [bacterium]
MKKWFMILSLWGISLLLAFWWGTRRPEQSKATETPSPTPASEASLATAPVEWRQWQDKVVATGNLTADPDLQSRMGAPANGRITELLAGVGDRVQQGQPLARLDSPEVMKALADYHHAEVRLHLAERTLRQRKDQARLGDTSRRPVEEARNEFFTSQSEVKIAATALELCNTRLRRTRDLLNNGVASQQQLDEDTASQKEAQARLEKARSQLSVAQEHRLREERLATSGSLITTRILEAETEAALAHEELEHSRQLLHNFGVTSLKPEPLALRAPVTGVVVARSVSIGQWVSAEQELFQIVDPRRLWLWLNLYENDFPKVHLGMLVRLPELGCQGRISYLAPQLEPGSRTQPIRVEINNPGNLRIGMFGKAEILVGPSHRGLSVPLTAVQGQGTVFVSQNGQVEARKVQLGVEDKGAGVREVVSGLTAGQQVVTTGSYLLYQALSNRD